MPTLKSIIKKTLRKFCYFMKTRRISALFSRVQEVCVKMLNNPVEVMCKIKY